MHKILKDFKGSPDGIAVIEYKADQEVELVPDLAKVAEAEKWAKPITRKASTAADPMADEIAALEEQIKSETNSDKAAELKALLDDKRAELAKR